MEGESVWSTREAVVVVVEVEEDVVTLETGTGADLVEGGHLVPGPDTAWWLKTSHPPPRGRT